VNLDPFHVKHFNSI